MKYLHKICLAAVLAALVAVLCGCKADDYALPAQVDMQPGESVALAGLVRYTGPEDEQATAEDAAALLEKLGSVENISFSFASGVPGVVSVDDEGVMTAGVTGDATVIVSSAALDYYAEVRVSVRTLPQSLAVEPVAALTPGENYTLNAEVRPGKKYAQLLYASADENIATVDENGVITAVATGETAVTAQVAGSSLAAVCRVVVTQEDELMQGITLSRGEAAMTAGETLLLSAAAYPENDVAVVWQSSDESVATVDETGMVAAVGAGAATVTATAGDKTASCTVTVEAPAESTTPEAATTGESATKEATATSETATAETATPESGDATDNEEEAGIFMAETWADTAEPATPEDATPETATPEAATEETAAAPGKLTEATATDETAAAATAETAAEEAATPETAAGSNPATPETAAEDDMEQIDLDVFYEEQTPETATAGSAGHDEEEAEQGDSAWPRLPNEMPLGPGPVVPQQTPETAEPTASPETAQPAEPAEEVAQPTPQTPETAAAEDAAMSESATPETATPESATPETAPESAAEEALRSVEQWIGDFVDRYLK